jgi:hypothetical protein
MVSIARIQHQTVIANDPFLLHSDHTRSITNANNPLKSLLRRMSIKGTRVVLDMLAFAVQKDRDLLDLV